MTIFVNIVHSRVYISFEVKYVVFSASFALDSRLDETRLGRVNCYIVFFIRFLLCAVLCSYCFRLVDVVVVMFWTCECEVAESVEDEKQRIVKNTAG